MQLSNNKKILAISGSLRSGSSNHNILHFLQTLMPVDFNYTIYDNLAQIPPFDPTNDHEDPPRSVAELRSFISDADAVIICTPEYAFGVPGQLKNALDWTVSSGSLVNKPLALITASTGGEHAHAALLQILGALSADILIDATLLIPFIRSKIDNQGNIVDKKTEERLQTVVHSLIKAIK